MNELDWPDVSLTDIDVQRCPQWSGLREVQPIFLRQPYEDWCRLFRWAYEREDALEWLGAGFARCNPTEVDAARSHFEQITAEVNDGFRDFLRRALVNKPRAARDVIALEGRSPRVGTVATTSAVSVPASSHVARLG